MSDAESNGNPTMTVWILWAAMLMSLGIYGVVLEIRPAPENPQPLNEVMLYAFIAVSVSELVVIFVLRHTTFFSKLEKGDFESVEQLKSAYLTTAIMTWALCESIAIFGFVLSILTGDIIYYFPFGGAGAVLMIYFRPQLSRWIAEFEEKHGGGDDGGDELLDTPVGDDPGEIEQTEGW